MSTRRIIESFHRWRSEGRRLALVTVVATEGSTYSKAGHRIVIADHGEFQGLVSGGCLEGDLAEHANDVIADGQSRLLTYDLRDDADEIWGLGIGCNGLIRVLLQRLGPENDYQPFATLADWQLGATPGSCALVVASEVPGIEPGASLLSGDRQRQNYGLPDKVADQLGTSLDPGKPAGNVRIEFAGQQLDLLVTPLVPIPRVLVLGAGPDAVPLLRIGIELGWRVSLADHRAAYLDNPAFAEAERRCQTTAATLANDLDLSAFDAVVVMSHHLETDRGYLAKLADKQLRYVGLLGPRARRERILNELGSDAGKLPDRLHGPVGLDIGADSPESIALATAAEIHQALSRPARG